VCLEIARPRSVVARAAQAWFDRVVPLIGRAAGQGGAYGYLVSSTQDYPDPERVAGIMREAGLRGVRWEPLTLGIVTLHVGRRPD
jgi:ubiquinone/menaquinone biosynthesis C-methylase UbiE